MNLLSKFRGVFRTGRPPAVPPLAQVTPPDAPFRGRLNLYTVQGPFFEWRDMTTPWDEPSEAFVAWWNDR